MTSKISSTGRLTRLAILVAVLLVMAYTPLGYLRTAGLEISFLMVPVVIGAIVLGPLEGAILGGVFGATSFATCFGASVFGATLLAVNPVYTFIVCVIPRILAGLIPGYIFRGMAKSKSSLVRYTVPSISGALINTLLFVGSLMLFFGSSEFIVSLMAGKSVIPFVIAFVGAQGAIEAAVCAVVGAAVSRVLYPALSK